MSRRAATFRRSSDGDSVPLVSSMLKKAKTPPLISAALVVGLFLLLLYSFRRSGGFGSDEVSGSHLGEGVSCTLEVQKAIPFLKKAYGHSMRKVLHVGPETCTVVSKLLNDEDTEAWGIEPYDLEDADVGCKSLMHLIICLSSILTKLSQTCHEYQRMVLLYFLAIPGSKGLNVLIWQNLVVRYVPLSIYVMAKLRRAAWWIRYFLQTGMKENEIAAKKFEHAASKKSYKPGCQVFHLSL